MGKSILLLGAGGHAMVVKEVIDAIRNADGMPVYDRVDFLDDKADIAVGKIDELLTIGLKYDEVFCAIGNNSLRGELIEKSIEAGFAVPVLIHPTAYISPTAVIDVGTVIEPKAIVNTNAKIGMGCIISVGSIVDHDVVIDNYSHVNAGAICKAGSVIESGRKLQAGEVVLGY